MFRSSRRNAVVALGCTALVLWNGAARGTAEEPSDGAVRAHVIQLKPRIVILQQRSRDVAGAATVTEGTTSVDVTLNSSVLFAKDSAAIRPAARKRLEEIGTKLAARSPGTLTITGHTDDLGTAEHGLKLSKQRAEAVRAELADHLKDIRVTATGKGEADPVVPNHQEKNRAKNRRVELHFTKR